MTAKVAVDTIVLIRGIRQEPDPKDPKAVARAKDLIERLHSDRIAISLPAVALAEFLAGTPQAKLDQQIEEINKNFIVEPFDGLAATYVGEIWRRHHNLMDAKAIGVSKQCLKVDCMIFATAIAVGASTIYAEDKWFHTIAKEYALKIQAKQIPKMADRRVHLPGMGDGASATGGS